MTNEYLSKAIAYIRQNTSDENATVKGHTESEINFPLTDRHFWIGKITMNNDIYTVYICKDSGKILDSISLYREKEYMLSQKLYGKLDKELFEKLDMLGLDEKLEVCIWLEYEDSPVIIEEIKKQFSDVQFESHMPITDDISKKAEIRKYIAEKRESHIGEVKRTFIEELQNRGISIVFNSKTTPDIHISATKNEILDIQNIPGVETIYATHIYEDLSSVSSNHISTTRVYDAWNNGYNGGVRTIVDAWENKVIEILAESLQVRSGPGPGYSLITTVYKGNFYPIVRWENDWTEIKLYRNINGWIFMNNNINAIGRFPGTGEIALVSGDTVNIYTKPGTSYEVSEIVYRNTELIVLEVGSSWTRVLNPDGRTGWISNDYITRRSIGYSPTARTIRVAVLETAGIDWENRFLTHAKAGSYNATNPYSGDNPHATAVAGCISSIERGAKGVAPGAWLLNANAASYGESNIKDACNWAIDNNADIINCSFGAISDPAGATFTSLTRYFDFVARNNDVTVVIAAGNVRTIDGVVHKEINTPAIGYNVLAVGNIDDHGTGDWSDDTLNPTSCTINPYSQAGDRHKPELSAPGTEIFTTVPMWYISPLTNQPVNSQGFPPTLSENAWITGTSFATPMVSGIAAILQEMNTDANHNQVLTRAILTASATHEVTAQTQADHWGLGEGTGTINVFAVRDIAQSKRYVYGVWNKTNYPRSYNVTLQSGQKIKGVLVWNSQATSENTDARLIDLNLYLLDNSGNILDTSATIENTVEIVKYTAPQNMTVTLKITANTYNAATAESTAIAWSIE